MLPERRQAVARLLAGTAALVAGTLGLWSLRSGLGRVMIKRVEVSLARLPPALSGTRIVQLSDVHVGPTIHRSFIETIVEQCNALAPDLLVITGDLVDGSVDELREHVAPLANLRTKYGVFFVTGNSRILLGRGRLVSRARAARGASVAQRAREHRQRTRELRSGGRGRSFGKRLRRRTWEDLAQALHGRDLSR